MRKYLLLLCFTYFGIAAYGQNSVPNGTFEIWTSGSYNTPQYYPYTSNIATYLRQGIFNVTRTTDSYHGAYAVQLATATLPGDTSFAYFVNIVPGNNSPLTWHGGMPYDQIPSGIRGYYKYNMATADSGAMIIAFSKAGINIRTYFLNIGGIKSSYTPFNFIFNPPLSTAPDSVEFGALSCKFGPGMQQPLGVAGSVLILDSVSFTGVTSQPLQMNGDFELWQSQTIKFPAQWYALSGSDQATGIFQTTDAVKGNYAIELITFSGNQNNHPAAQPAAISTGYYPANCSGSCFMKGGYPFSNKKDTLVFSYKYVPSGNDKAMVYLNFKKNGSSIYATALNIDASSVYINKEFPFEFAQDPDTVIVSFASSVWQDTALSYVGSSLKIDEVYFKSQALITGISKGTRENDKYATVFPNPSDGRISIRSAGAGIQKLEVYDVLGKVIYSDPAFGQRESNEIDLSKNQKGIYFIKIFDGIKTRTETIIIK